MPSTLSVLATAVGIHVFLATRPDAALDVAAHAMVKSDRPAPTDGFDDGCNAATPLWVSARTKARCASPAISPVNPPVKRSAQMATGADDQDDVVPEPTFVSEEGWPEMPLGVTDGLRPEAVGQSRRLYRRRNRRKRRGVCGVPESDNEAISWWLTAASAMAGLRTGLVLVHPPVAWAMWTCVTAVTGVWILATDRHFWWPVCAALSFNYWGAVAWIGCTVSFEAGVALAALAVTMRGSVLLFPSVFPALFAAPCLDHSPILTGRPARFRKDRGWCPCKFQVPNLA